MYQIFQQIIETLSHAYVQKIALSNSILVFINESNDL